YTKSHGLLERYWQLKDEGRTEGFVKGLTTGRKEDFANGFTKGREEQHKRAREEAQKLKQMGVSFGIIATGFGLSPEENRETLIALELVGYL
ncbi:MAG: hypothetical protein LBC62_07545, partial [Treponema sp.]|nr:hypothetical protein [Treponema sp.]